MDKVKNICVEPSSQANILNQCKELIDDYGILPPQVDPVRPKNI